MGEIEEIKNKTKEMLVDILLSGFEGINKAILDDIEKLIEIYNLYNMQKGKELLKELKVKLLKSNNGFKYDKKEIAKVYSQVELYLSCL